MENKEEEEEIELELGLSIGGSYKKKKLQNGDVLQEKKQAEIDDPMNKKEMQALKSQEAKKKRELKRSIKKGESFNNGVQLEASIFEAKDTNFVAESERESKKNKKEETGFDQNLYLGTTTASNYALPVVPYPYLYPALHYGLPLYQNVDMGPYWFGAAGGGNENKERNAAIKPLVTFGFGPVRVGSDSGLGSGYDSEQNGSRDEEDRTGGGSNESFICTSSAASVHKSSSLEGGGSSDTRNHSSYCAPGQWTDSKSNSAKGLSEHSGTSHLNNPALDHEKTNHVEEVIASNSSPSSPSGLKVEMKSETEMEPDCADKNNITAENPNFGQSKETSRDMGKPPKPQNQNPNIPSPACMPCVSTTGNGPNGKTINGFLYRYTKTEVSIICVCHGRSFSPTEFVHHAGGTDVSHPLRHITVIPSTF